MRLLISLVLIVVGYRTSIAQELITNGGAELPIWVGWLQANPADPAWSQGNQRPPHSGSYHFYPGGSATVPHTTEIYQTINVSANAASIDAGTASYTFSGWRRGYKNVSPASNDMDRSEIIVEYRDASGNVLASYDTGSAVFTAWTNSTDTRNAPVGTRMVYIRLISVQVTGTDNDGYYDDISFVQNCIAPTSVTLTPGNAKSYCLGKSLTISGTVSPANPNYYYTWYKDGLAITTASKTYADFTKSVTAAADGGTYKLRVEDGNAGITTCYLEASVVITLDALPIAGTISSNQEICLNTTANPVTGTVSAGGTSVKNYKWQRSTTSATGPWVAAQAYNTTATGYSPGAPTTTTYYRRIDSSGTCAAVPTNSIAVRVNNNALISPITPLLRDTLCAGEAFQLTGNVNSTTQPSLNGGYYYSWRKVQGPVSSVIAGPTTTLTPYPSTSKPAAIVDSGTYYLVVQDGPSATLCKDSVKIIIRVNQAPVSKGLIQNNQELCLLSPASILAEIKSPAGYIGNSLQYQWYSTKDTTGTPALTRITTAATGSSYNPVTPVSTIYFVRKDSIKYCTAIATNFVKIRVNNTPILDSVRATVNDTLCENLGDPFQLKGYIDSITAGKASVNGGYYFTWKKLQSPSTTAVTVSTTGKYSDYPAVSRPVVEADSGTYYLVIQDGLGATKCLGSISIKMVVFKTCMSVSCAKPDFVSIKTAAASSSHLCAGNTLTLQKDVITLPADPPAYGYYYSWTRTNTLGTVVIQPPSVTYKDLVVSTITAADSGRYQLIVQDGTAAPASCAERSQLLSIVVTDNTQPSVSISNGLTCQSTDLLLTATPVNAGTAPTYAWEKAASATGPWTPISGAATSSYLITNPQLPDSGTVYKVIVSSSDVCNSGTVEKTVVLRVQQSIQPKISVSANPSGILCDTLQSITYTATPVQGEGTAPAYQWYNGSTNNSIAGAATIQYAPAGKPTAGDKIYVVMTSNLTCASTTTATSLTYVLNIVPKPKPVILTANTSICLPNEVLLTTLNTASTGSAFQWYKNGAVLSGSTNTSYTVSSADFPGGTYTFEESNSACASIAANTTTVTIIAPPIVSAGTDFFQTKNTTTTLQGSVNGSNNFIWKPATGLNNPQVLDPDAFISNTISYTLIATDATGLCSAQSTVTITVEDAVKIPNVLTPNGDGVNDTWNIEHIQDYPSASCIIYNRWGNIVWKNSGSAVQWNGTNYRNGELLPDGTYFYIIDLKSPVYSNPYTGYVQIVR